MWHKPQGQNHEQTEYEIPEECVHCGRRESAVHRIARQRPGALCPQGQPQGWLKEWKQRWKQQWTGNDDTQNACRRLLLCHDAKKIRPMCAGRIPLAPACALAYILCCPACCTSSGGWRQPVGAVLLC